MLWIGRTGAPWCDLPAVFGHWNPVFRRFRRWSEKGVFERVSRELSADADFEYVMVDGTTVQVHRHVAGAPKKPQAIEPRGAGAATKIVAPTGAPGDLVRFAPLPAVAPLPTRVGSSGR